MLARNSQIVKRASDEEKARAAVMASGQLFTNRTRAGYNNDKTGCPTMSTMPETAVADAVSNGSARVFDLEIVAIDDEDPSAFSWYYHDADAGEYHAIRRQSKPARGYRAALEIDPATGDPRTYSGLMPTKAAALAVLHHLAPAAVELPGLPAWLR